MTVNGTSFVAGEYGDARWWKRDYPNELDTKAWAKLIEVVRRVRQQQDYRKRADLLHASTYGSLPMMGLSVNAYSRTTPGGGSTLALNVCKNMVSAVVSKLAAKARPRPSFVTEGGDYEKQHKAEQLDAGVSGVFYRQKMDHKTCIIFRDCAVFGTGFAKVFPDHDEREVVIERVMPWEIVVDDTEALYGEPRSLYHLKYYDKTVLAELYPDHVEIIERTTETNADAEYGFDTTAEQLLVREAWHLPARRGAGDGRHMIAIDGATLVDEPWEGTRFPFAGLRWSDPLVGFFGTGLVEELSGIQAEINKLLRQIQDGHHLITGHYLVENGSKVISEHLNNDLASIVKYSGSMPQYQAPSIIAPEVYQHLWALYAKAYEITGISQLAAQSQKPAGLDSGAALREYNDQQTERFLEVGQSIERWTIEVASLVVDSARALAEDDEGYVVRAMNDDGFDEVDWSKLDNPNGYEIKAWPVSQIPSTPSGRMQFAQDMMGLGVFDAEDLLEAIQLPDTQAMTRRKLASRKLVERSIGRMLNSGKYESPEPFQNLAEAKTIATNAYLEYRMKNAKEERLQLLRDYILACDDMLRPKTPPPPAPGMPGAGPGLPPGAPPAPGGPMMDGAGPAPAMAQQAA